ncbi:MAG: hypothetical protein C0448_14560 [Sphingobacteriaceae bacterium]|nr:hypothetical protein [Sphingobacteriaceae bacterium]
MNSSLDFVTNYFSEEKIESLFFIIIGSIAVLLALIFLLIIKYSFFKGMAIPLLLVGTMELIVGSKIYQRTPSDIVRVEQNIKTNTRDLQTIEIPRIEIVLQNFVIYKWIEICLILTSIILILVFYKSPQTFWKGLGLGLLIQACLLLCLNVMAEQRAETYLHFLLQIV